MQPKRVPGPAGTMVMIVEDDDDVRDILHGAMEREGFGVVLVADGESALEMARSRRFDLVILDLGLPGMSGIDVLRQLRAGSDVPIIVVSGHSGEADRVVGLELGADDYVVKPFSPREVVARARSVLRRLDRTSGADQLVFDGLTIDLAAREVHRGDEMVSLTNREFDLLAFLAAAPRRVFSPRQLLRQVWEAEPEWQDVKTVGEHIYRVRQKVETDPGHPRWLVTVRGSGYRFDP